MRTLAIGDIHGCRNALVALMKAVQPTKDDRLVYIGDYVDRGPDSQGVIDWILAHWGDCETDDAKLFPFRRSAGRTNVPQ